MRKLIAKRAILLGCKTYDIGDALPAADERMVNAWIAAGSAEFANSEPAPADVELVPAVETNNQPEPAPLEALSKDELKKLADDKGIKLPRGAAKALIIDRLRSEGGAQ